MHIWTLTNWQQYYDLTDTTHRSGARLRFDKDVNPEVRRACREFLVWLRSEYFFPIRVPIYIKSSIAIKAQDGEQVSATFFEPVCKQTEPYIRVATGDYDEMLKTSGKDNALSAILGSIAHELTHYFQWVNDLNLTVTQSERQALRYVDYIVDEYAVTREHP